MRFVLQNTVIALVLLSITATATHAQKVVQESTHADWALFKDEQSPHRFCFVSTTPKNSEPTEANRDQPRVYISAWPKDGIKSELSFRMGFPVDNSAGGTAAVDAATFNIFANGDRAYIKDPTQELKLVEAMRQGQELTIRVTSTRGTIVTDTYSLMGVTAALNNLQRTCF